LVNETKNRLVLNIVTKNRECLEAIARRAMIYEVKCSRCSMNSIVLAWTGLLIREYCSAVCLFVNIEAAAEGLMGSASFPGANNVPGCLLVLKVYLCRATW